MLIVGEAGTGKRQVARAIHQNGPGRNQPLVPFDCEALPAEILERELFAALKARARPPMLDQSSEALPRRPRMTLGEGSTLLIREIFMLPRDLQARLAASLESRHPAAGHHRPRPGDRAPRRAHRPDLYYAVTTLVIRLRPLRERRDELPLLAQHLLERANQRGAVQRTSFSPEALTALLEYDWPGNLTELARVIDHAHAIGRVDQSWVAVQDLPASIRGNLGGAYLPPAPRSLKPLDEVLVEVEQQSIERPAPRSRQQVTRRRAPRHLSPAPLPPDQGAQSAGRHGRP